MIILKFSLNFTIMGNRNFRFQMLITQQMKILIPWNLEIFAQKIFFVQAGKPNQTP